MSGWIRARNWRNAPHHGFSPNSKCCLGKCTWNPPEGQQGRRKGTTGRARLPAQKVEKDERTIGKDRGSKHLTKVRTFFLAERNGNGVEERERGLQNHTRPALRNNTPPVSISIQQHHHHHTSPQQHRSITGFCNREKRCCEREAERGQGKEGNQPR